MTRRDKGGNPDAWCHRIFECDCEQMRRGYVAQRPQLGRKRRFAPVGAVLADQLYRTLGVLESGGEPRRPDFIKHPPKRRLRSDAHGSIRVHEGQPRGSFQVLILLNAEPIALRVSANSLAALTDFVANGHLTAMAGGDGRQLCASEPW